MLVARSSIEKVLNEALSTGADFAEIFAEDSYSSHLSVKDRTPKTARVGRQKGAGIRVFFGLEEIYVTTNDLSENGLLKAARQAAQARPQGAKKVIAKPLVATAFDATHTYGDMPWEVDRSAKFDFLMRADQTLRSKSSKVTQAEPTLVEKVQNMIVANSEGTYEEDRRTHYRYVQEVIVEDGGVKESFHESYFDVSSPTFYENLDLDKKATEVVDNALLLLKSEFAPAGEMPVVIEGGFGGVIFHEACGHGLETTSVAKNASVFCGKLGERVAQSNVTAIDDGTLEGEWGTLRVDDEGNPTQKTTLIENGILKSYMVDRMGGLKTGYKMTGSSRRQNYKYAPTSRMRNTYIAAGTDKVEDMIRDVDYGIYAANLGGGSVSPGTGDFNFGVRKAFMIRNGKIAEPVKGATLIGRGIDTLGNITKVGDQLTHKDGMCGSVSGSIPAAVGQPAILVSKMTIGGRA
jgi:TldD protein